MKFLVLHPSGKVPKYLPFGKIAGMESVYMRIEKKGEEKPSLSELIFGGGPLIILMRCIAYFLTFLLGMSVISITIIVPIGLIGDLIGEKHRKRIVEQFKKVCEIDLNDKDENVFQTYILSGTKFLTYMERLLGSERRLDLAVAALKANYEFRYEDPLSYFERSRKARHRFPSLRAARMLLDSKLVHHSEEKGVTVETRGRDIFVRFLAYLRQTGYLKGERQTNVTSTER
ncbi:hypothetical protein ACFL5S_01080 [Fibrobacterota bacterium]